MPHPLCTYTPRVLNACGWEFVPSVRLSFRNWSKGGQNEYLWKRGGAKPCVHVHKHMYSRGVWGHAPPKILDFRLSETASGAFSGTLYWIENLKAIVAIHCRLAISKWGQAPPPLNEPLSWCTYPMNETLIHQQLSLYQLHYCHPSQRRSKWFFHLRDVIYLRIKSLRVLSALLCFGLIFTRVVHKYKAGEAVPRYSHFDKLMSGSSLDDKAFFKKPQNSELEVFLLQLNL